MKLSAAGNYTPGHWRKKIEDLWLHLESTFQKMSQQEWESIPCMISPIMDTSNNFIFSFTTYSSFNPQPFEHFIVSKTKQYSIVSAYSTAVHMSVADNILLCMDLLTWQVAWLRRIFSILVDLELQNKIVHYKKGF